MLHYLTNLFHALDFSSLHMTLLRVASVLMCLIFHEVCHGVAAYFLGDPTAKKQHRLSLNPLRHIDFLGFAAMLFTGVGWAKPVPVNPNYFKKPKLGMAITALAGPVSNFLLAIWLLLGGNLIYANVVATGEHELLLRFMLSTAVLSLGLGLFNLIPIPPLDGSKILAMFLPDKAYRWLMRYERFGMLIICALVCFGTLNDRLNSAVYTVFMWLCQWIGYKV